MTVSQQSEIAVKADRGNTFPLDSVKRPGGLHFSSLWCGKSFGHQLAADKRLNVAEGVPSAMEYFRNLADDGLSL